MVTISRTNIKKLKRRTVLRSGIEVLIKDVENNINDYGDSDIGNKSNIFARVASTRDLITGKLEKV